MPSIPTFWLLLGSVLAYGVFYYAQGLRSNVAAARRSGLPYVIAPVSPFNLWWQIPHKLLTPAIRLLPKVWWEDWLDILQPDWSFRLLRKPWDRFGDTFLIVSPYHILLSTCDADVIHQVTSRREAFPKPTAHYGLLAVFGRNMLCTEGAEWKMHRKGVSSSFNEKNAAFIFGESIKQAQGMIAYWMGGRSSDSNIAGDSTKSAAQAQRDGQPALVRNEQASSPTIETLEHDTMTLALNIITHVGFGLRLLWPGQSMPDDVDARTRLYGDHEPSPGHSMTFAESLAQVLEGLLLHLLLPARLLKVLPFKKTRSAWEARWNYEKYMEELLRDKIEDAQSQDGEKEQSGMDIMGQMVRAKYGKQNQKKDGEGSPLSDSDILGNSFIVLVAGHETTANTIHFALIELARNPTAQHAVQADVDRILGRDSDPLTWEYEKHVNALMASNIATSMNEVLRLTPSVVDIPKEAGGKGQSIVLHGQRHILPAGTDITLNSIGAHRNPRYWPTKPGKDGAASDLDEFVPERWYRPSLKTKGATASDEDEEDFGGFKGPDTSAQLYRPLPGSFIPFSEGARSCIGRRIAQVEMVAALAVLFQQYSVELAVDAWASDEEVDRMGPDERRVVYEKARKAAAETVRQATSLLTLKLHGELKVPIRLVRRGRERFCGLE
ncbi:cytochrome P450 [Coniella lustricola]|uniref:Cytochrome P450 n=1 Tax=Coniella lustricola TaxID=2025994 RepID=A0A2T3AHZ9_9PEZI|nr:cytochrome P450 [Coniella lustricola]